MKKTLLLTTLALPFLLITVYTTALQAQGQTANATLLTEATIGAIEGRQIGPARMSGRISAIDGVDSDPNIIYVGAAGGGVWKSINQGTTFKPVFEDFSQSIGAIAIDQQHPDTVWVGTGEPWVRNSVSIGTGIYKTVNGGEKFESMGLQNSERIAGILIHPENPDIVWVAVLGALWGDSEERGVYKTTDGGKSWQRVLFTNASSGCASIALHPTDPNRLLAAMWDHRRTAYDFRSGGPGSGLFESTDGGATWTKAQDGIDAGTLGRVAVSYHPVAPYAAYALVETANSALYTKGDKDSKWLKMSTQGSMGERPFYFSLIVPDPLEASRIYKPGFSLLVSTDGGKIFQSSSVTGGGYHSDLHALYISPKDNRLMYLGTDGGVYISRDKGNTWSHCENLPVSQFYHVSVDMESPYNVYGGLQDNGSWRGPSSSLGGIQNSDWETIGYGDGFNAFADRQDPQIVYWQYQGGRVYRTNLRTGESKYIKPFPDAGTQDLRFNWNAPVVFGKKSGWLYIGSQYLYRSKDKGDTWERISPDLTTNDPKRQQQEKSGGVTIDNSTAENNTTIFTIAESAIDPNIIWVGTDDGQVQVTADGGKTWQLCNAQIPGLPAGAYISHVETDNFDKNGAYITVDGHRNGDMRSYVYYTNDLGKTFKNIVNESVIGYCHVIKQDLVNPDLLFLGTEFGLYMSIDRGANWVRFKGKVPQVGVFDMAIHPRDHDLVLATHGRGIIIIDDLTILRNLTPALLEQEMAFLPTRPYYFPKGGITQDFPGDDEFVGRNAPGSPMVAYYMKKRHVFGEMFMEIYDSQGKFIKKQPAGNRKGVNIVSLQTSYPAPRVPTSPALLFEAAFGPAFPAGDYTVKIIKGTDTMSTVITLHDNPASGHSAADRQARYTVMMEAYDLLEELAWLDNTILEIGTQTRQLADSVKNKGLRAKSLQMANRMDELHGSISATQPGEGGLAGQVRLRERIAEVYSAVSSYEGKPTNVQADALKKYQAQVDAIRKELAALQSGDLPAYNQAVAKLGLKPVTTTSKEEFLK